MHTRSFSPDEAFVPLVVTTLGLVVTYAGLDLDNPIITSLGAYAAVRAAERVILIDTPPRWRWAVRWLLRLNRRIAPRLVAH